MHKLVYIENKSNEAEPPRIGFAKLSKTGKTLYHGGRTYYRVQGYKYNHVCEETGEEFWISGPKKNGQDALYGTKHSIIDPDAVEAYWKVRRS